MQIKEKKTTAKQLLSEKTEGLEFNPAQVNLITLPVLK